MIIATVFTVIGVVLHIWLVSTAYIYIRTSGAVQFQFQEIRNQLQTFMAFKSVTPKIQRRVLTLYDFTFHGNFFEKFELEASMEKKLQSILKLEISKTLLEENYLFKRIPENLLCSIADCLVEVSFSTNDVIMRADHTRTNVSFEFFEKF
jgi:hypothetical protein